MPRPISWASPVGIAPTEAGVTIEINCDLSNKECRLGTTEDKEETTPPPEPSPVKGEQTGQYLDRVGYRGEVPTGEERQAVGGEPDGREPHEGGHALQHQQLHQAEGGESCTDSMHIRMPRSKSWASPGGIAPIEQEKGLKTNNDNSPKESRQAVQESNQGQHGAEERDTVTGSQ